MVPPSRRGYPRPLILMAAALVAAACSESAVAPDATSGRAPSFDLTSNVYTSGAGVMTWDPITPSAAYPNWESTICTSQPLVGPNANWQNPHDAIVVGGHPWANFYFSAPWINAWSGTASVGPGGHNWTKYETQVSGNGTFVIRLLADNCSWVYLDGVLVGVQPVNHNSGNTSYGLTLNGTHTLSFIIFDGGGAAGGKFRLETTTNPPPPLNPDLDGDTHPNDDDAFPLDPSEWDDSDGDGVGDNGDAYPNDPTRTEPDADADDDGVNDDVDNCPAVSNDQADLDGDGQGDACDADDDGDGVNDGADAFPRNPAESADTDGDGVGNNADAFDNDPSETVDSDGDGVGNNADAFDNDPSETVDSDGDGVGNNTDAFDNSNRSATVMIGTCDSGVTNRHLGNGSWFNDLIGAARATAGSHGQFVNAVSSLADGWKKAGLISGRDQGAIVSCAARSR